MSKLRACPFCGEDLAPGHDTRKSEYWLEHKKADVACVLDGTRISYGDFDRWNKRSDVDSSPWISTIEEEPDGGVDLWVYDIEAGDYKIDEYLGQDDEGRLCWHSGESWTHWQPITPPE